MTDPKYRIPGPNTSIDNPTTLEDILVEQGQKVTIQSRGVVRTGDYVGYVNPEGTDYGIFGIGQSGAFNEIEKFPNNILICKLDTEKNWRRCAAPPKDSFFPMPWQTREACFIASQKGYLQFDTNDKEPEKRQSAFFVKVIVSNDSDCQPQP
jgi:hypothetical protein